MGKVIVADEGPAPAARTPGGRAAGNGERRPLTPYQAAVRGLSDRLVEAQRPIRVLDAVQWGDDVERAFFAAGARKLPPVSPAYYAALPFDPDAKRREFRAVEWDVRRLLGPADAAGRIITRMCEEYRQVVDLLVHRGTPHFGRISARLYGSSADRLPGGGPDLAGLGRRLAAALDNLSRDAAVGPEEPALDAAQTVAALSARLAPYFGHPAAVRVKLSDGIVADAAAGGDCIKVRQGARFSPREVRLLEVHEGWVHLGTTLNGQRQPVCTFLAKGPPSSTLTQEGLAVVTEVLAFASHPARVRRLANRVEGVARAEAGADFLEVYRFFLEEGGDEREAYQHTVRVFRGGLPQGGCPFTKDLCYSKGFVLVYDHLRRAVADGLAGRIPLLFCGKTSLGDADTLAHLADEGLLAPPRHVPPPFADLHSLCAWMCYADVLQGLPPR